MCFCEAGHSNVSNHLQFLARSVGAVQDFPFTRHRLVALTLNDGLMNLPFIFKIGVDGAPPFVGCIGDVEHGGVLHPFPGEELTGHFYETFTGLAYHAACILTMFQRAKLRNFLQISHPPANYCPRSHRTSPNRMCREMKFKFFYWHD